MTAVVVGIVCFIIGGMCGIFCVALATASKHGQNIYEERD